MIALMGASCSPLKENDAFSVLSNDLEARQIAELSQFSDATLYTPSKLTSSSPAKGPLCSSLKTNTPRRRTLLPALTLHCNKTSTRVFLPPSKVKSLSLKLSDEIPKAVKDVSLPDSGPGPNEIKVCSALLKNIAKNRRCLKQRGKSDRVCSQNKVMGGQSANSLALLAGLKAQLGDLCFHWCHRFAYSLLGPKGQKVWNLVLGTKQANAEMTLVEHVIGAILKANPSLKALYVTADVTFVKGYESIRLAQSIAYTIKDGAGTDYSRAVTINFDMLSRARHCLTKVPLVREILKIKFNVDIDLEKSLDNAVAPREEATTSLRVLRSLR